MSKAIVHNLLVTFVLQMQAKKLSRGIFKNFVNTQILTKIRKISIRKFYIQLEKEANELMVILEDKWWLTAKGFVPIIGNTLDLSDVPESVKKAINKADVLATRIDKILKAQGKKAKDLIPETLKRVQDYPSELENLTYTEIVKQSRNSTKAAKMKKLIEQEHRLMEKTKI